MEATDTVPTEGNFPERAQVPLNLTSKDTHQNGVLPLVKTDGNSNYSADRGSQDSSQVIALEHPLFVTNLSPTQLNAAVDSMKRNGSLPFELCKSLLNSVSPIPQEHQFATPTLPQTNNASKKVKSPFSIDNLLADRMKVIEHTFKKRPSSPEAKNQTEIQAASTPSSQEQNGCQSSIELPPTQPSETPLPSQKENQSKELAYPVLAESPVKIVVPVVSKVSVNNVKDEKPEETPKNGVTSLSTTTQRSEPTTAINTPQFASPQKVAPAKSNPSAPTPPTPSAPIAPNTAPTEEPVFKVPLTGYQLEKYRMQQKKNEIQRARGTTVIWSRTVLYPQKGKVYNPPLGQKIVYVIPDEPPIVKEKEVPKEEIKKPVVFVPKEDALKDYSVDVIFLALTQEHSNESVYSGKSLKQLVQEKQEELDASAPINDTSTNIGEDARYAAQDLEKLKQEIENDAKTFASESTGTVLKRLHQSSQSIKRGRPKKNQKKGKGPTEPDTDSYSEEQEDEEEDDFDDDFDINEAIREIDEVHDKVAKLSKTPTVDSGTNSETAKSDDKNQKGAKSAKRKPAQDAGGSEPKQRRSTRIKNNTTRMNDFFYESAVSVPAETDAQPTASRKKNNATKNRTPSRSTSKKAKTNNSGSETRSSSEVSEPSPGPSEPPVLETPKKTRAAARVEHYSRRVTNETVNFLLRQILIPTPPEQCEILDHFKTPIVRRAIVNRNTLCYAISMLQLLLRVPQVYCIIRSHTHDEDSPRKGCFICLLANIISERPRFDDYPSFIAIMRSTWKDVEVDKMHCVMEAMQHFFNKFDEEYMLDHPQFAGEQNTHASPIRSFFEIEIINEYRCKSCVHVSTAVDKAVYISIDLTKKSDGTMQNLVDNIGNPTAVHGMDCPICEGTEFNCVTRFRKLPEVLLYFVPRVRTKKREKDMTVVHVQKQLVIKDEESEHKYALCAFLTHSGITGNKGHYKAFEVNRARGQYSYNEFDDAKVVINSKLSTDVTVVLAMFRKEHSVAKDEETDMIFDGRGNIMFAHEKHCKQE